MYCTYTVYVLSTFKMLICEVLRSVHPRRRKNKVKLVLGSQNRPQKGPKNRPQKWASCMQFVRYKLILQPSNTDST